MTRYVVDKSWRREGAVVSAGSPLTRFTFSGTAFLEQLESGSDIDDIHAPLVERLIEAGAIHPLPGSHTFSLNDVTVVVPARVTSAGDARSLDSLLAALPTEVAVIVVDDGSPVPFTVRREAHIIQHTAQRGAAAARNTGLNALSTPFVAFLDLDVEPTTTMLWELLAYFVDERVGLVAPRVRSRPGPSLLARYETTQSPLDLGDIEARVRAGTRIAYVPSAAWLCRTSALQQVRGFDESMPTGEDVDVVWRLDQAGWHCRYQPEASCLHQPRGHWTKFIAQRMGYGRSAALLAAKHGSLVAPARTTAAIAGAWGIGGFLSPPFGLLIALVDSVRTVRRLQPLTNGELARLTIRTQRHAGSMFAQAITRTWWPIAVTAAVLSRRSRRTVILAAVLPAIFEWRHRRPPIDPLRFFAIRMLDHMAYGFGVWQGARRQRSATALLPAFSHS